MSTRKRNNNFTTKPDIVDSDLPRRGKVTGKHKTHLPGSKIAFGKFIYLLSALLFAFIVYNVWRLVQYKTAVGGWWNLALGRGHSQTRTTRSSEGAERENVEDRIISLAKALGIPSRDLASAIAEAVKHSVPPASLSSVSAAEATESGTPVNILVGDKEDSGGIGALIAENLNALSSFDDPLLE
ncbi:hypothetical protein BU17DRAFT_55876 [Hysterangium stoloniferum]|nr:hypothetical protein BU17DRAFT_55876 [Hysterangium stoloniferum]